MHSQNIPTRQFLVDHFLVGQNRNPINKWRNKSFVTAIVAKNTLATANCSTAQKAKKSHEM